MLFCPVLLHDGHQRHQDCLGLSKLMMRMMDWWCRGFSQHISSKRQFYRYRLGIRGILQLISSFLTLTLQCIRHAFWASFESRAPGWWRSKHGRAWADHGTIISFFHFTTPFKWFHVAILWLFSFCFIEPFMDRSLFTHFRAELWPGYLSTAEPFRHHGGFFSRFCSDWPGSHFISFETIWNMDWASVEQRFTDPCMSRVFLRIFYAFYAFLICLCLIFFLRSKSDETGAPQG